MFRCRSCYNVAVFVFFVGVEFYYIKKNTLYSFLFRFLIFKKKIKITLVFSIFNSLKIIKEKRKALKLRSSEDVFGGCFVEIMVIDFSLFI